ncbi:MAG: helix-turn-helix domain-containing protein [Streptococcaceae bacterium]|jgi:mannitol operon transcriptional antiterminator|nr:helix-turn-helix domain-containing protein [Streptococcaceae bacterium]
MLVTSREQKIIQAFTKKGTLTIAEMLDITGTSRRTLYRDLENIQNSLPESVDLRSSEDGYFMTGDVTNLTTHEMVEFTATERLYGELMLLVQEQASISSLTETFGISQPTATNDLRLIDQALQENGLTLRHEGGLKILGDEEKIRSVLVSGIFSSCSITDALSGHFSQNKILSFLDLSAFELAKSAFEKNELPGIVDKTRILMQFFLTASLLRLSAGYFINSSNVHRPSKNALAFVKQLIGELDDFTFTIAEITYLASIYDVLYFGFGRDVLFIEKFDADFSYKIRELIDKVSDELELEFIKDDKLYGLLYAHLKETEILPELFSNKQNDFVKKIEKDIKKIFDTVQKIMPEVFEKKFSDMEVAFVSLHFAATLERSDAVLPLSAALVTSRGHISCEFLISSLRKNFPFLKRIDIIQTSASFDKSMYDAIFTTEKELDYIYIDRSFEQKNLDVIRHQLREIQRHTKKNSHDDANQNLINLNQLFNIGNDILSNFAITEIDNLPNLSDVVRQVVNSVNLPQNREVAELLLLRFNETHLAIPETQIALLHGVHASIEKPLFKIFDLSTEVEVTGMNREKMMIKRVLLLLSPLEVEDYAAYLLGKISSSIIENKLYTTIYDSGNVTVVNELLRKIMTEAIREYGK